MSKDRIAIWKDAVSGVTPQGNGIGSFWAIAPKYAFYTNPLLERSEYAHSEPIHFAFELGVGSLLLAAAGLLLLGGGLELERGVLVALGVAALLAFPFHMPVTGFMAALVAGRLARARDLHERAERGIGGDDRLLSATHIGRAIHAWRVTDKNTRSAVVVSMGPQPAKAARHASC